MTMVYILIGILCALYITKKLVKRWLRINGFDFSRGAWSTD